MRRAMQGSGSEESYAANSSYQNYSFHTVGKPRLREAIQHLMGRFNEQQHHRHIAVADLGCSYGRNALDCAEFVIRTLHANCISSSVADLEIQYFFSDLPSNDFNALFQSLESFLDPWPPSATADDDDEDLQAEQQHWKSRFTKIFAAGVPGSFYGRLFPSSSIDLVICSHSLHWLSQVPPTLLDRTSSVWNGGHTWMSKTLKSFKNVQVAYVAQSKIDVKDFLKNRADEVRKGGILFLLSFAAPPDIEDMSNQDKDNLALDPYSVYDFIEIAWQELVDEGSITLEEKETFNLPIYFFNQQELEDILSEVSNFKVLHMETIKNVVFFPASTKGGNKSKMAQKWVGMLASALKPTMEAHVGKPKADMLFKKLENNMANKHSHHMSIGFRYDVTIASLLCL